MGVRLKNYSINETEQFEYLDNTQDQRETVVDGYTFHWGINETRNFLDDGVGIAHEGFAAANATGAVNIVFDRIPFGDARS